MISLIIIKKACKKYTNMFQPGLEIIQLTRRSLQLMPNTVELCRLRTTAYTVGCLV